MVMEVLEDPHSLHFQTLFPEDQGDMFLQNNGKHI
jgi:hypothetical protein